MAGYTAPAIAVGPVVVAAFWLMIDGRLEGRVDWVECSKPSGGLPRAPDGTGRLPVVRPGRPKGRTAGPTG